MATELNNDLYQITMLYAYFRNGEAKKPGAMEAFTRKLPTCRNFYVFAGLGRIIEYLYNLSFSKESIQIINEILNINDENFNKYLLSINFAKELKVFAMPEGTIFFPQEPVLRIEGPIGLCQYVEKTILSILNHDIRIASKAIRIVSAAAGRPVLEFGGRREHEECTEATARAAFIAGFSGTSNVNAYRKYGVPVSGTMGHVWVMSHDSEAESFEKWNKVFPNSTYLVDTYETINGTKNAIKVNPRAIRLDSGDLYILSTKTKQLINNSNNNIKIIATNDLDEYSIADLLSRKAPIDSFGVGTQLVSSPDSPSIGVVYKLVEVEGRPVFKKADTLDKCTWPGKKQVFRSCVDDYISLFNSKAPGKEYKPLISNIPIMEYNHKQIVLDARKTCERAIKCWSRPIIDQYSYPVLFSEELQDMRNK